MPPDPTIFEDVVVDESENVNNDQENERICLEISLFFAMKCLDLIQEETESIEEFFFHKSDDKESTKDLSSEESTEDEEAVEENNWLYPQNGCAICETCIACLTVKKRIHMHRCLRMDHLIPTNKKFYEQLEFYGSSMDGVYRFFSKKSKFQSVLDESKGDDIVANVCATCYTAMQKEINYGRIFFYIFKMCR